jgi:hypothetical protein
MEQFEIKSGEIHFSDPCYDDSVTFPALNGVWGVDVDLRDDIVHGFVVYHTDHKDASYNQYYCCSVDSGQFGVFDASIYTNPGVYFTPGFYHDCCEITLQKPMYGVVYGLGFVSSSGYGDGSYSVETTVVDDKIVKLSVIFVD